MLLFGWGEYGTLVEQQFAENRVPGYVVKALVDRRKRTLISQSLEHKETATKTIEHLDELFDIVRGRFIDEILVALPEDREVVKELIVRSRQMGVDLRVIPDAYDGMALGVAVEYLGPFPSIQIHEKPIPRLGHALKRCIDVLGASIALVLSLPVCFLIAGDSPDLSGADIVQIGADREKRKNIHLLQIPHHGAERGCAERKITRFKPA